MTLDKRQTWAMSYGRVWLSRGDFNDSLIDEVAFSIAFASGLGCRDKEAALEALREEAKDIIEIVKRRR